MPKLPKDKVGRHYELLSKYFSTTDSTQRAEIQSSMDFIWNLADDQESKLITAQVRLFSRANRGITA